MGGGPIHELTLEERLELAAKLYREFHADCFWYAPSDLAITEDKIPFVVKGLRERGGRRGFQLSAALRPARTPPSDPTPRT
ncbi:MAG: hypothetical protein K2W96_26605 [Gemmataceae bacterium]|nr:hypothetical protein [Gemmataceae bacterium]